MSNYQDSIQRKITGRIIDYLRARHAGDVQTASSLQKDLMRMLGKSYKKTMMAHGDPDAPDQYQTVLNAWQREYQKTIFVHEVEKYINDVPNMTTVKVFGSETDFMRLVHVEPALAKKLEVRPLYPVTIAYSVGDLYKAAKGETVTHDSVDVTDKIDILLDEEEARMKMSTTIRVPFDKAREFAKILRASGLGILKNFFAQAGEISVFVVNQPIDRVQKYLMAMAPSIYPDLVWESEENNMRLTEAEISKEAEAKAREAGHATAKKVHGKDYNKEEADKHIDKILAKYKKEHDPKDHGDIIAVVVHSFRHDPAHKDEAIEDRLAKYLGE
jgi:hypothetical protein